MSYLIDNQVDLLRRILQQQAEKNIASAEKDKKIRELENEIRKLKGIDPDPEPESESNFMFAMSGYCSSPDPISQANSLLDLINRAHSNLIEKVLYRVLDTEIQSNDSDDYDDSDDCDW